MTGRDDTRASDDSLLRALACAPDRAPEGPDPARIAQFRIVGRLGRGGMGIVYHGEDETLRRPVAIKVLRRAAGEDDVVRRRFLREARAAAAVDHPNVATVYEVGEADGRTFIAMQLVDGETLRARLQAGPMDLAEALRIAKAVARGLASAHDKGIVHRDLKPENVMIARDGEVKVLDFGLAKLRPHADGAFDPEKPATESVVTEEGVVMGTLSYMSPEQATGGAVDARSDVFSFGVVLYEMVTGRRPFTGATGSEFVASLLRDEPARPSRRNPRVGGDLERLILRCLRKKPEERFSSAKDLAVALEATRVARPRRWPAWATALAAAAAASLVTILGVRRARVSDFAPRAGTSEAPSATPLPAVPTIAAGLLAVSAAPPSEAPPAAGPPPAVATEAAPIRPRARPVSPRAPSSTVDVAVASSPAKTDGSASAAHAQPRPRDPLLIELK
jgi:serine/threonine-protein kinase